MTSNDLQSSHDDALVRYLDELLGAERDAEAETATETDTEAQPEPEAHEPPGVLLSCGTVLPDDERHYVCDVGGVGAAIPATRVIKEQAFEGTPGGVEGDIVRTLTWPDGSSLLLVDLAALILPPSAPATQRPLAERLGTLTILDDGQWAIASAGEARLEALDLDKVVWRGEQSSRVWLAGTLVDRRLVLLDLDALVAVLP